MKKEIFKSKSLYWILSALIVFGIASCKKQTIMGFVPGTGAPTITSVSALSSTVNDTSVTIVQTYDTLGNVTTTVDSNKTHQTFIPDDSTKTQGSKQNYYVIHGTNLGTATTVSFNGVSAYFNRAYGTDNSIIVSIPLATPTTGTSATNKIVVVTPHGTASFSFTTLTPPPTVTTVSTNDFYQGSEITVSGVGFATVTSVGISGTTSSATIVSQTDAQIVLQFPSVTVNTASLIFSYNSAGKTVMVTTTQVFNNLDNAYVIFTEGYENGWFSNSWGTGAPSTAQAKTGTTSWAATYPKGNYWADGFGNNAPLQTAGYTYLAFWLKGGLENYTLYLTADTRPGGFGNSDQTYPITVPANVWTYFKLPLSALSLQGTEHFGFWIPGPTDQDETFYFDDVVLLK